MMLTIKDREWINNKLEYMDMDYFYYYLEGTWRRFPCDTKAKLEERK